LFTDPLEDTFASLHWLFQAHDHQVKLYQPTLATSVPIISLALNMFWFPTCNTILTCHDMSPSFAKEELRTRIHLSYHPLTRNVRVKILILLFTAVPSFRNPHDIDERN
jgi:hypothetical protein